MSDSIVRAPGGAQPDNPPRGTPASDDVTLIFNGKIWSGWTAIRIGRGVERFPSDFELALTERYPGEAGVLISEPGTSCVLKIGKDTVITGYIDRYTPAVTAKGHEVRIQGRSKCADLVDCSAGLTADNTWVTQFVSSTVEGVMKMLAAPFAVSVITDDADDAEKVFCPPFVVNLGETPGEIIDRISRWAGLLYYDNTDGNLVLSRVGKNRMSSGFQQGVNVEAASAAFTMDQRFSRYVVLLNSVDALFTVRENLADATNGNVRVIQEDTGSPKLRYRPHIIISGQTDQNTDYAARLAIWEMNRRNGRSRAITLTTSTWRDSAGALWEPNRLVQVDMPLLKIRRQQWVIGEVTYRLDATGTHADLTLMPPEAYGVEPFVLQPVDRQVQEALNGAARNTPQYGAS